MNKGRLFEEFDGRLYELGAAIPVPAGYYTTASDARENLRYARQMFLSPDLAAGIDSADWMGLELARHGICEAAAYIRQHDEAPEDVKMEHARLLAVLRGCQAVLRDAPYAGQAVAEYAAAVA